MRVQKKTVQNINMTDVKYKAGTFHPGMIDVLGKPGFA